MIARYLNLSTWPLMVLILKEGVLRGRGLARKDPDLYRLLKKLRDQGLVKRRGYKYFPTRDGWRAYFRFKDLPRLDQYLEEIRTVPWEDLFKVVTK